MKPLDRTDLSLNALDVVRLEAVLELAVLAAQADGAVDELERSVFRKQVIARSGGAIDGALADIIMERLETTSRTQHLDDRLARVRMRLPDLAMRESALAMAAVLVFADHELKVSEEVFMKRAAEVLEITPERAKEIVDEARTEA